MMGSVLELRRIDANAAPTNTSVRVSSPAEDAMTEGTTMATLAIDVTDEHQEQLAAFNPPTLDRAATPQLVLQVIDDLACTLDDLAERLHAIHDTGPAAGPLRDLALDMERADLARRMRSIADGLEMADGPDPAAGLERADRPEVVRAADSHVEAPAARSDLLPYVLGGVLVLFLGYSVRYCFRARRSGRRSRR
jgi:hypothetical protein